MPKTERHTIKEWRDSQYMTMAELAAKIGTQTQTIWRWEHDKVAPSTRNLRKLAEALGIHPSQIIPPAVLPKATPVAA